MKNNMTFLGIDQSLTNTGVCFKTGDEVEFHSIIPSKKLSSLDRLNYIAEAVDALLQGRNVSFSCLEAGSYGSGGRLFELGQASCIVQLAFHKYRLSFVEVAPTQLKKFFTGWHQAPKHIMLETANSILKASIKDDNLADAFALACVAEALTLKNPKTRKAAEVVHALLTSKKRLHEL